MLSACQPAIVALPPPLRGAVAGQPLVASPSAALAELVANALDAGATEINAEIDLRPTALHLRVQDNGTGVAAASMRLLGQRFASSRRPAAAAGAAARAAPPPLGYRGEALAAIRETAAAVEVTTRAAGSWETLSVRLEPGGGLPPAPTLALEQRARHGTLVTVRSLFAAQPVRLKALQTAGCVWGRPGKRRLKRLNGKVNLCSAYR